MITISTGDLWIFIGVAFTAGHFLGILFGVLLSRWAFLRLYKHIEQEQE